MAQSDNFFPKKSLQALVLMWRGLPWPSPPSGSADTKTLAIVCRSGLWMVRQPSRTVPASQLPGRREGWALKKTLTFAWDEVRCRSSWEGGQLTGWALHTDWRWSGWSVVWSHWGWNREQVLVCCAQASNRCCTNQHSWRIGRLPDEKGLYHNTNSDKGRCKCLLGSSWTRCEQSVGRQATWAACSTDSNARLSAWAGQGLQYLDAMI